jgi:Rrf2 family protein
MISQTAEYALRAIVCLAARPTEAQTSRQIAGTSKVPAGYLAKVMQSLVRAGIVRSQRGQHGGFTLRRPPEAITVLEVVNAVDPVKRIHACPLDLPEHRERLCPLHQRLDEAAAIVEKTFRTSTIAEMLEGRQAWPAEPPRARKKR